ncbi:MAG TPA: hypothetical protein PLI25_02590 [bacterium]|jgi:hypothetical protein|nr:hypothetical protein [bacterium]
MKNRNLLIQNLLIFVGMILCWGLFLFYDMFNSDYIFSDYIFLFLISLIYQLFYFPFLYIQSRSIVKNKNITKLNKTFRVTNLIFIFLFIMPVIIDLVYNISTGYYPTNHESFFSKTYLSTYYYFLFFDSVSLKETLSWFLHTLPYFIISALLFGSIKFNKKIIIPATAEQTNI